MKTIPGILVSFLIPVLLLSQPDESSRLYSTIQTRDSLLFAVGFNTCDIRLFDTLVSDNFEFYHDQSGAVLSKQDFIADIRDGLCTLPYKPRRELVEHSVEVYPLRNNGVVYGAVQTGEHRFYALEQDKPEYLTSTARFTHVWLLEHGEWKISRVLSYNHQSPRTADTVDTGLLFADRAATEQWMRAQAIPAVGIGSIRDGKIQEVTVYGSNEHGNPYPNNTIFNVASLTKPITAMVVLKLVDAGTWNLDEPIYRYWTDPDVAHDPRSRQLTTRHILSHQSGFPNWRSNNADGKLAFEFAPGTAYQYSGEGFEYLRRAVEHATRKTLEQLAEELIFQPLGMKDTRFYWDSTMDESRFAKWHREDGSLYNTYRSTSANGADDVLTTVEDYSRFMVHIINGAGLRKELYQEMISEQVRIQPRKYFGLGWWVDEHVNTNEHALVHGGDDIGVHTIAFLLPDSRQGLLIITNSDNGTKAYIPIIHHYLGTTGQEIIEVETR